MSQTAQPPLTPRSPTVPHHPHGCTYPDQPAAHAVWTVILFCAIAIGTVIGIPLYGYLYHYTWLDWSLFGLLYTLNGLGITVGYHGLMAHRTYNCPNWVKGTLLIAGAWALQNSGIKWASDHLRHHAHCDEEKDPYNNYHHMYPTEFRNGPCWYHFDPSKWLILGLYSLRLATSLRTGSYVEDSLARTN